MAKKVLRKFRVRKDAAPHFEPNPDFDPALPEDEDNIRDVEYGPGEIVKSTRPLHRLFVNKFEPLSEADAGDTAGGDVVHPDEDPNAGRPVRNTEDATTRRGNRFLDEEELEGKEELKKLAKGKKIAKDEDEDEEEDFLEEEPADDESDDSEEESTPKKKKKKKSKG